MTMVRLKQLLFASIICVTSCVDRGHSSDKPRSPSSARLQLNIELRTGEHSKDSNEQIYRCQIQPRRAEFYGPYGQCPRGQCQHRRVSTLLTKKKRAKLTAIVHEANLLSDYEEIKSTKAIGHYYDLTIHTHQNTDHGTIRVVGMSKSHNNGPVLSDQARHWVTSARDICTNIRELAVHGRTKQWVE